MIIYKCVLCDKESEGHGNNPVPLCWTGGKCCDKCNEKVVIARIMQMQGRH